MKYLKKFSNHNGYDGFINTDKFIRPNVSICKEEIDVHFNQIINVASITLNKSKLFLNQGETEQLIASVLPLDATNKNVKWTTDNENIASIDNNGIITVIADEGNTNLTAITEDGKFTYTCNLTIKNEKSIIYESQSKLSETSRNGYTGNSGLHVNAFIGENDQNLNITSHTFKDGVGVIVFNNLIKKIDLYAFEKCNITNIYIPNNVTSIGERAFNDCNNLINIDIPKNVINIDNYAFYNCNSLISIDIPNSVTSIGDSAFSGCNNITNITIGSGVTNIGNYAFNECSTNLISIKVNDNNIFYDSRNNCNAIINTNNNILILGCSNTIIPNSVTSIGSSAFYNCNSLISIDIPNSVTNIGISAFYNCNSLLNIIIGNGITSIDSSAFYYCNNLESIKINANIPPTLYTNYNNDCNVFSSTNNCPIYVSTCYLINSYRSANGWKTYKSRITALDCQPIIAKYNITDINNSVKIVGTTWSYDEMVDVFESIEIDDVKQQTITTHYTFDTIGEHTVKYMLKDPINIGDYSFYNCKFNKINIPNYIVNINAGAFWDCYQLKQLNSNIDGVYNIPNNVKYIGQNSFRDCTVEKLYIPNSVTSINSNAFRMTGYLTHIISNAMTAPSIYDDTFSYTKSGGTLYVPIGSTGYDSWLELKRYSLGSSKWNKIEIENPDEYFIPT